MRNTIIMVEADLPCQHSENDYMVGIESVGMAGRGEMRSSLYTECRMCGARMELRQVSVVVKRHKA